jgi:hypothetical protein
VFGDVSSIRLCNLVLDLNLHFRAIIILSRF